MSAAASSVTAAAVSSVAAASSVAVGGAAGCVGEQAVDRARRVRGGGAARRLVGVGLLTGAQRIVADRRCVGELRRRDHHRHRPGGRREVDVLVELAERHELGDDVGGDEPGTLERLHQAVAPVDELVDLLAREITAARQLAQRPLAVGAGLLHHLATLLLGHRQLGLGVGLGVLALAGRFLIGLLAQRSRFVLGLAEQTLGGFLGLVADRRRALAGGLHDASGLLTEQAGQRLVVELGRHGRTTLAHRSHLALEVAFAVLHPRHFCRDHAQELAHLLLVESAPCGREVRVRYRRRRGRVGPREGDGHSPSVDAARAQMVSIGQRVAAKFFKRDKGVIDVGDRNELDVVARDLASFLEVGLAGRDEEVVEPGLAHRGHLLRQAADRADVAVELDRPGHRDVRPAEQVAVGELVDQREREREAGARTADLAGVDLDLERQLDRSRVERDEADDRSLVVTLVRRVVRGRQQRRRRPSPRRRPGVRR